jgi:hypothetical protein
MPIRSSGYSAVPGGEPNSASNRLLLSKTFFSETA